MDRNNHRDADGNYLEPFESTSFPYISEGASKAVKELHRALVWFAVFTAILYIAVVSLAIIGYVSNKNRVDDIQEARAVSCQRTYEGIREVFKPLFPTPEEITPEQAEDLRIFNETIDGLKAQCDTQVQSEQ